MPITFFKTATGTAGSSNDTTKYSTNFAVSYKLENQFNQTVDGANVVLSASGTYVGLWIPAQEQQYTERYLFVQGNGLGTVPVNSQSVVGFGTGLSVQGKCVNPGIYLVASGGHYSIPPTIAFSAPSPDCLDGTVAEGGVLMSGDEVAGIQVINGGAGYLTPPTYSIVRHPNDTETEDAVPLALTSGDLSLGFLDKQDRGSYLRVLLPVEEVPAAANNLITPTSFGTYDFPPIGVVFSPASLSNGRSAEGRLVLAEDGSLLGVELTYPGRGYLTPPTITLVRDSLDIQTDDATFPDLTITGIEYLTVTTILFDRSMAGVSGSPVSTVVDTSSTLHTSWIFWPESRQAKSYIITRDGEQLGTTGDITQLPFEDVYPQTGVPRSFGYAVSATYVVNASPSATGTTLIFDGETSHIGGLNEVVFTYSVSYARELLGPAEESSYWNPYGTAYISNSRRLTGETSVGAESPLVHPRDEQFVEPGGFSKLSQGYQLEYEQWSYLPAQTSHTSVPTIAHFLETLPDELLLFRIDKGTGNETQVITDDWLALKSKTDLPFWVQSQDVSATGQDTRYEIEFVFDPQILKQKSKDGKWYMMWPSVSEAIRYRLYYKDGVALVEIPLEGESTTRHRDVQELVIAVSPYREGRTRYNQVTWNSIPFATGYDIYRKAADNSEDWVFIDTLTSTTSPYVADADHPTSFTDYNVDQDYVYKVDAGRDPDGYVVKARVPVSLKTETVSNIAVRWEHPHDIQGTYQIQRRVVLHQLNPDGSVGEQASTSETDTDATDDGVVVVGERSQWIPMTGEEETGTPVWEDFTFEYPTEFALLKSLEYRLLFRHVVPMWPENNPDNWAGSHIVYCDPIPSADRYSIWVRIKIEGDPYFDEPYFKQPGSRYGLTRLIPVATNIALPDNLQVIDVQDYSVPLSVNYTAIVGPLVPMTGSSTGPKIKGMLTPYNSTSVYTIPWITPGISYSVFCQTRYTDGITSGWETPVGLTVNTVSKQVTDSVIRSTGYSIKYKIRGASITSDTVTL